MPEQIRRSQLRPTHLLNIQIQFLLKVVIEQLVDILRVIDLISHQNQKFPLGLLLSLGREADVEALEVFAQCLNEVPLFLRLWIQQRIEVNFGKRIVVSQIVLLLHLLAVQGPFVFEKSVFHLIKALLHELLLALLLQWRFDLGGQRFRYVVEDALANLLIGTVLLIVEGRQELAPFHELFFGSQGCFVQSISLTFPVHF